MRRTAIGVALVLALSLAAGQVCSAASAAATESDPLATVTTIQGQNMDLREVLGTIFRTMGAEYILAEEVNGKIDLNSIDRPVREILDLICAARGLNWWKSNDVYIVSSRPAPAAGGEPEAALAPAEDAVSPGSQEQRWRSYEAQFRSCRELSAIFNAGNSLSATGEDWQLDQTAFFGAEMARASKREGPDTELLPFSAGKGRLGEAAQFPGMVGGVGIAPGTTASDQQLTAAAGAAQAGQLLGSQFDLRAPLIDLVPSDMTPPVAYEPLNLLVYRATDEAHERFLELVRIFDRKPKQVLVEVQYITMSTEDAFSFGIDWFYNVGSIAVDVSGLAPAAGNFSVLVTKGENFSAFISTLLSTSRARVVQAPRILATNMTPASIQFTDRVPYVLFSGSAVVPNGGVIGGGTEIQWENIVTNLNLFPQINADESVTMLISPQISNFRLVVVPGPEGITQEVPATSTGRLTTTLTVDDGETVVIGGFVNRTEADATIKIPILGDLPVIGKLFTRKQKTTSDSELLIFITPHIIRDEASTVGLGPL